MTITQAATVATRLNQNWLSWFKSRESANTINKTQQERLFKTFDATVNGDDMVNQIEQHEEMTFLHKVNFGEHKVAIFHHLKAAGGTIYDNGTKEYGFFHGLSEEDTIIMTPDITILKKIELDTDTPVPALANLLNVKTNEEVVELTVSTRAKYRARNIIPIPPFLLDIVYEVIAKKESDAITMLVDVVKGIKEFDTTHAGENEYKDKAKNKCKEFVYWLYLVGTESDAVVAVNTIVSNNTKVKGLLKVIASQHLQSDNTATESMANQVEMSLKRPFEVLAATSSSTTEFMEKLTQLQTQNNEKSSKTFKKIPAKYQQMILIASSESEVTKVEYDADASEFFRCSTPLHAQVMINSLLEAEGIECSVSTAMSTTLLYGSFLWRNALSPAGLAASVLTSEGIIRSDTLQEGMVLDFATKFDMSAISLSKLTKTQVLFPKDVEELTHRIRGLHILASFFFKKTGFMSQGIKQMVNFCLDNRSLLKTKIYLDNEFIAKFMCAIDERVYLWLKQCSIVKSVVDTDLTLMNYSSIIQDIKLNRFVYILPPTIASLLAPKQNEYKAKQKQTSVVSSSVELKRNQNQVEEWKLRRGESWSNIFRNKAIEGPMLSTKCHPCLKYHVRGACYVDCKNRESHVVLKENDKKKMNDFIKSLRGE